MVDVVMKLTEMVSGRVIYNILIAVRLINMTYLRGNVILFLVLFCVYLGLETKKERKGILAYVATMEEVCSYYIFF